jgi:hypothetical protein
MPTASSTTQIPAETRYNGLRLFILVLYLTSVAAAFWSYFVLAAPERWRFIRIYLENWFAVFKG